MRTLALAVIIVMLATPVFAGTWKDDYSCDGFWGDMLNECQEFPEDQNTQHDGKRAYDLKVITAVDAPDLIKATKNISVGAEAGKDWNQTSFDQGWYVMGKVTYRGTLLDFTKK